MQSCQHYSRAKREQLELLFLHRFEAYGLGTYKLATYELGA
jgi:hypothetical protein